MSHRRPANPAVSPFSFLLVALIALSAATAAPPPARPAETTTRPATTGVTTKPAAQLGWKTERLVVFKDGYGLVIQAGRAVADAEGRAWSDDVPEAAVLGCFWAVGENDNIVAMKAEWIEATEKRSRQTACLSMTEILRANVGKGVSLEMGDHTRVDGRIERVLDVPQALAPLSMEGEPGYAAADVAGPIGYPLFYPSGDESDAPLSGSFTREILTGGGSTGGSGTAGTLVREINPRGGNYVVIAQNERKLVLPAQSVQSVTGGDDVATEVTREQEAFSRTKRLSFDFGAASAGKPVALRLFYFTPGLRWIPTYRVGGDLADKAAVSLQGEILNDVTDVEHAALDLVVGVPNFRFAGTVSPLTLEQVIRSAALAANLNMSNSNMLQSQFRGDNRFRSGQGGGGGAGQADDATMTLAPELAGSGGEQDLFVYNVADFSLKKGARATVPLWRQTADLKHVYTFDIRARRNRAGGGLIDDQLGVGAVAGGPPEQQQDPRSPNRIVLNQVWHQLELTNGGSMPWTTGAALMLRGNLPLGQDLLVYTPPAGKARLPVTVAVDLRGSADEQEIGRTPNALRFDGDDWSEVRKKGSITVTSFRKEKSAMCVTLSTGGKVSATSDEGKIKLNDFRAADWDDSTNMRVNNHSDVTWEFELEPGKSKTLTYEVSFYIR